MITTIAIFIIILGILVFVHEFGHFIVAKKSGMSVEEFGFGFPPRIAGIQKIQGKFRWVWGHKMPDDRSQTVYSINWIPLGGFVKIVGENNEHENHPGSFINKGFWPRFLTLVAGVSMNVVLAWFLLTASYTFGAPAALYSPDAVPDNGIFTNAGIGISEVQPGMPADKAGIQAADLIISINSQHFNSIKEVQDYIKGHTEQPLNFEIQRGKQSLSLTVIPNPHPGPDTGPTGVSLGFIGELRYPWYWAPVEGAKTTWAALEMIVKGVWQLISGQAGLAAVGGPVKIAQYVGQAKSTGFMALLNLTVLLSLSLAVLNILPFPALDGGRVLFLLIEKIRGKRNNQKVEQVFNTAGFVFLLLMMLVITIKDVKGLF